MWLFFCGLTGLAPLSLVEAEGETNYRTALGTQTSVELQFTFMTREEEERLRKKEN